MKIILQFNGGAKDFERAFDSMDDQFDIGDSIFSELDYGDGTDGVHRTEFGDIEIVVER